MLFVVTKIDAQDIHFSQFFETPLLRNPALAGIFSGDVRLTLLASIDCSSIIGEFSLEIYLVVIRRTILRYSIIHSNT